MAYRTSAASAKPKREVIRPDSDGVKIRLDKNADECLQVDNKGGVQYQYVVNNNAGIMWIPKEGRDALIRTGARAGDMVEIWIQDNGSYGAALVAPPSRRATEAAQQQTPEQAPPEAGVKTTRLVSAALRISIDALCEARQYAAKRDIELGEMTWEDVRALGITLMINKAREGR